MNNIFKNNIGGTESKKFLSQYFKIIQNVVFKLLLEIPYFISL